jgi:hypothetical protein
MALRISTELASGPDLAIAARYALRNGVAMPQAHDKSENCCLDCATFCFFAAFVGAGLNKGPRP